MQERDEGESEEEETSFQLGPVGSELFTSSGRRVQLEWLRVQSRCHLTWGCLIALGCLATPWGWHLLGLEVPTSKLISRTLRRLLLFWLIFKFLKMICPCGKALLD